MNGATMSLRENLTHDAADALRFRKPVEIASDATVADAIQLMKAHDVGYVLVTDGGTLKGIFTERDVLTKVLAGELTLQTPIADVMTRDPQSVDDRCSVATIIKKMHQGGFRHMPVVDGTGQVQGMVSVKRIVEYLVEHVPSAVFNLPPEPAQHQAAREGA